jgi:hypothetical protein
MGRSVNARVRNPDTTYFFSILLLFLFTNILIIAEVFISKKK